MRAVPILFALLVAQPALAQTAGHPAGPPGRPVPPRDEGWSVTVGAAFVVSPVWQGSRDTALSLFPDLRVRYKDSLFASIPGGVGWNAVNRDGWKAGPIGKLRFGRNETRGGSPFLIAGGSDALIGLGNIGAAFELGGFVEKRIGAVRGRVELRQGFGGHEGVVADLSAGYQQRLGRTIVSIGPRASVASMAFMNTYFGIDAVQSQRSGLVRYATSGGLVSYGVGTSVIHPLNRRSALTLFAGVDRLGEKPGHSSLVVERGRRMQATAGLGYGFRFGL